MRGGQPTAGGSGRLPDDPTGRGAEALAGSSEAIAQLISSAEYSRGSADRACSMVPVGKVVATLSQRAGRGAGARFVTIRSRPRTLATSPCRARATPNSTFLLSLLAPLDDGCGVVTVGEPSLPAHDRGLARFGLPLLATILAASGLAIGWTVAASVEGRGEPPPAAVAPITTPSATTPTDSPTPAVTARPTATPPSPPAGGATASSSRLDPQFGMGGDLLSVPLETATSQIDMLADDGLGVVGFELSWRDTEPSRRTYRGLDRMDAIVDAVAKRSMQAIVVVSQTPAWANGGKGAWVPPTDPADYADFVGMLAKRFAGHVAGWEVWNAPDQARSWEPRPDPTAYARMLVAASHAIRAADPSATVIGGGIAADDTDYARALYDSGVKGSFDVLSIHPPASGVAPDDANDGPGSLTGTLDDFHNLLRRQGDEDLPIWVTDLGWAITGRDAVSAGTRADYLQRAVDIVRERPWVGLLTVRAVSTEDDPGYGLSTSGQRSESWDAYASAVRDTGG